MQMDNVWLKLPCCSTQGFEKIPHGRKATPPTHKCADHACRIQQIIRLLRWDKRCDIPCTICLNLSCNIQTHDRGDSATNGFGDVQNFHERARDHAIVLAARTHSPGTRNSIKVLAIPAMEATFFSVNMEH